MIVTRDKAFELVQKWLDRHNADPLSDGKRTIAEKLAVDKGSFWVIYYNCTSPHASNPLGPVFVDKSSGKLYNTGGSLWYNWIKEFENFKTRGHSEIDWTRSEIVERPVGICEIPLRNYFCLRLSIRHEEREQKLRAMLLQLRTGLASRGLEPCGNPEMMQRNKTEFASDIEIRIPFTGEPGDDAGICSLPQQKIYYTEYTGNHYDFVNALLELKRYGRVNRIKEKGELWVEYLNCDLAGNSDTWLTRICIPIE
jgi:effector-binding domain-containing protein